MPDAFLLDFNGVLVDDEELHRACFNEVLAAHGVVITAADYQDRYLGFDDRGAFMAALRDHGHAAADALVHALIARKAAVYARRAVSELRLFPGAAALVTAVASRGPVAVVSGALRSEIEGALALLGVREGVGCIVAAEDVTACKPDPEGYRLALTWLSRAHPAVRHERVVALEDSLAGIASARSAGVAVAAVAHSYPASELASAGARPVFATLSEVTVEALESALALR